MTDEASQDFELYLMLYDAGCARNSKIAVQLNLIVPWNFADYSALTTVTQY